MARKSNYCDYGETVTWQFQELIAGKVNHKISKGKDIYLDCDRLDQPKVLVYWSWSFQNVWG